jgi:hypothetical protein
MSNFNVLGRFLLSSRGFVVVFAWHPIEGNRLGGENLWRYLLHMSFRNGLVGSSMSIMITNICMLNTRTNAKSNASTSIKTRNLMYLE